MNDVSLRRPHDVPKTFYPGMWLHQLDGSKDAWCVPHVEVLTVGRKNVTIQYANHTRVLKVTKEDAQSGLRKVYASEPAVEIPEWLVPGRELLFSGSTMKVKTMRWNYVSVYDQSSNALLFISLPVLLPLSTPILNVWERLST